MSERDAGADRPGDRDTPQSNLGEMLRRAREHKGLAIEDLARGLRLEPRIIQQLEGNRFDLLPAPAFVRGYLRSIAKDLDIDPEPLIAVLNQRTGDQEPTLSDFESRAPLQITSDSNVIRYTTVALVIVTLVLVSLWWRARDVDHAADADLPDAAPAPKPRTAEPPAPLEHDFSVIETPGEPLYSPPLELDEAIEPAPAATAETGAPATGGEADADIANEAGAAADAADPAAPGTIVIRASEDAWVDVRDAGGERLYYDLARAGRELSLGGTPPFRLVIGNSPVVSLSYDGVEVPLADYSSEGIARLSLGPDGPAAPERPTAASTDE
ncbi:MAG: helix-turn-helix domain-containing protein [Gammaproteobacteria bacterium]